ncbi:hypothetical protein E2562_008243 [Oryza meyeriana var. granulata]|uniref:Uncharacterized protein n=1 Tax=Oryza meyeriana var. granulata TaxID=110450 RepID=A0A6G1DG09_9ORYZ|nr:hypothetical protein E2562_008243 [Oryza meyeriana var. granulata]
METPFLLFPRPLEPHHPLSAVMDGHGRCTAKEAEPCSLLFPRCLDNPPPPTVAYPRHDSSHSVARGATRRLTEAVELAGMAMAEEARRDGSSVYGESLWMASCSGAEEIRGDQEEWVR